MEKVSFASALKAGGIAAGIAAVINAILFFVFHSLGIITDDIFIQPGQPMTIVPILISSIVPTLIASVVYFLLDKFTNNGFQIFRIISIVLLVLSFINPFVGIPGVTVQYAIALNVMHVVVVVALLFSLQRAKN